MIGSKIDVSLGYSKNSAIGTSCIIILNFSELCPEQNVSLRLIIWYSPMPNGRLTFVESLFK